MSVVTSFSVSEFHVLSSYTFRHGFFSLVVSVLAICSLSVELATLNYVLLPLVPLIHVAVGISFLRAIRV